MTPVINLSILAQRFTLLSRSAYFDPAFRDFSERTVRVIEHVLNDPSLYPDEVIRFFHQLVWRAMQFVRGSRSNDAPHETQFVLRRALAQWDTRSALISSAALDEFNFFLNTEDLWEYVNTSLDKYDTQGYNPRVVRIGSPEALKNRPIYCIPLFHELGHFIDLSFGITELSLLLKPPAPVPVQISPQQWQFINTRHRMEHFADLFSACYCGTASSKSLIAIAPNNTDSLTHPSTAKRVRIIDDFLNNRSNDMIDLLQGALAAKTRQQLSTRFSLPAVRDAFDDVRTVDLKTEEELFGLFSSAWDYAEEQVTHRRSPWIDTGTSLLEIEKTINDLVEKSLRNFEIRAKWAEIDRQTNDDASN